MRRAAVLVREDLLEEATRLSGERTYSRTVDRALKELIERHKSRQILTVAGSGSWTGELGEMRRDAKRLRGAHR
jgi:hypothetical protein